MKAIEKDRARRYDTANAFADDVQRYLSDELVSARPPSAMYRTSKFVRRNKGTLVSAAAVLVLVGLSAFVIRTITQRASKGEEAKFLAKQILVERPVDQAIYLSQVKPIAKFCIPTWKEIFKGNDVSLQGSAAYALEYFAKDGNLPQSEIAELLAVASPKQFQILFPLIKRPADSSFIAQLRSLAATPSPEDTKTEDRVKFGQARAGAGITLLRLGDHQTGLNIFRMESDLENQKRAVDPEALAQFVHRSRDRGVTAEVVADCLKSLDSYDTLATSSKDAARYALLLALAEFPEEEVEPKLLDRLVIQAGNWYRDHPLSSVHGATRYLLYTWNRRDLIAKVDQIPIAYTPGREWFNREIPSPNGGKPTYMTFIVFQPGEFKIGSPDDEPYRQNNETQHLVRITRPFAIADREITREEIIVFGELHGIGLKLFPGTPGTDASRSRPFFR